METFKNDSNSLVVHLLDMGNEMYGDCILCQQGERSILIDGGHPSDFEGQEGFNSIPEQLSELFKHQPPFNLNLLIVTHYHNDHIGCLPELVKQRMLTADYALLADEKLGSGQSDAAPMVDISTIPYKLAAVLREEDYSVLSDNDLEKLIQDAIKLEERYKQMISDLKSSGTKVIRFGRDQHGEIETEFADFGLKIVGPSQGQLAICANAIAGINDSAIKYVADAGGNLIAAYRQTLASIAALPDDAEDKRSSGSLVNNQSIVFTIGNENSRILMTGDMQLANPELPALKEEMKALREAIKDFGPYQLVKLSHHAATNGFDQDILDECGNAPCYVMSGGINDKYHPSSKVLDLLKEYSDKIKFARTDGNGKISVTFSESKIDWKKSRGTLNDFTPKSDMEIPATIETELPQEIQGKEVGNNFTDLSASAKIPSNVSQLVVTFDIVREKSILKPLDRGTQVSSSVGSSLSKPTTPSICKLTKEMKQYLERLLRRTVTFAHGRKLPPLLFVTYESKLAENIGLEESRAILTFITESGHALYRINDQKNAVSEVRKQIQRKNYSGIVIIGNYDVVPAQKLDTLPASLRNQLGSSTSDADNFVVWNDEAYGDHNGDGSWDIPVSRIPDGKNPKLLLRCLCADRPSGSGNLSRFGVRNIARPFAETPFGLLPGSANLLVSEPTTPSAIGPNQAMSAHVYFMLHGSDTDATRFWGESDTLTTMEAVNVNNVPREMSGIVFTGCCWGALPVNLRAVDWTPSQRIGGRTASNSIALAYLEAGALAFIGCTGTHYSPTIQPYNYFGGPMHKAFWKHYLNNLAPAQSLFNAKLDYLAGIPHNQSGDIAKAIEYKILRQFCCLGLGW